MWSGTLPSRSLLQVVEGVVWNGEVAARRHFKRYPHVRLGKLAEEVFGRALKQFSFLPRSLEMRGRAAGEAGGGGGGARCGCYFRGSG